PGCGGRPDAAGRPRTPGRGHRGPGRGGGAGARQRRDRDLDDRNTDRRGRRHSDAPAAPGRCPGCFPQPAGSAARTVVRTRRRGARPRGCLARLRRTRRRADVARRAGRIPDSVPTRRGCTVTPARIAIVDDDPAFSHYLSTLLTSRGYDVTSHRSGTELLRALEANRAPDVVLLDVLMPGMDGLETLRMLRTNHPGLQVIMLSGTQVPATIVDAVRLGAV